MANPLDQRGAGDGGGAKITVDFLEDYARQLNRMNFSIGQGLHWFVNKRTTPDGETQRFLDSRKTFEGFDDPAPITRQTARALRSPER